MRRDHRPRVCSVWSRRSCGRSGRGSAICSSDECGRPYRWPSWAPETRIDSSCGRLASLEGPPGAPSQVSVGEGANGRRRDHVRRRMRIAAAWLSVMLSMHSRLGSSEKRASAGATATPALPNRSCRRTGTRVRGKIHWSASRSPTTPDSRSGLPTDTSVLLGDSIAPWTRRGGRRTCGTIRANPPLHGRLVRAHPCCRLGQQEAVRLCGRRDGRPDGRGRAADGQVLSHTGQPERPADREGRLARPATWATPTHDNKGPGSMDLVISTNRQLEFIPRTPSDESTWRFRRRQWPPVHWQPAPRVVVPH